MKWNLTKDRRSVERDTEEASNDPVWIEVDSSFVEAIAYNDDGLYVTLSHGSYLYNGVPEQVFEDFKNASSKGQFFNLNVKDIYTFSNR